MVARRRWTVSHFESLESRIALDADGPISGEDRYITLSFADDGVDIGGSPNTLHDKFQAWGETAWQNAVLRAVQTWAKEVSLDVGLVDETEPVAFGSPGPSHGDLRFGDIRVGARALANDVKAISVSQGSAISGTWSADVVFNSEAEFESLDDLFSVSLHEAGHVFGLSHSEDVASPMHVHGVSNAVNLTPIDIQQVRQRFGTRLPDRYEDNTGNEIRSNAAELEPWESVEGIDGSGPALAIAQITTPTDVDWYSLALDGDYAGPLTFRLRTAGISLLQPGLTVVDEEGQILFDYQASDLPRDVVEFVVPHANPDSRLFVQVKAASEDVFAVGGYSLTVTLDQSLALSQEQIEKVTTSRLREITDDELGVLLSRDGAEFLNDDMASDDDFQEASRLESQREYPDTTRYLQIASLSGPNDRDFYRFRAPAVVEGETLALQVVVRSLDPGAMIPAVAIFDRDDHLIPHETLVNGNGEIVVQVRTLDPERDYTVAVSAEPQAGFDTGNYQLAISFPTAPVEMMPFVAGAIDAQGTQDVHQLYVATPQLFHLLLSVAETGTSDEVGVLVRIFDAEMHAIHQVAARPGEIRSAGSVLLNPGTYFVEALKLRIPGVDPAVTLSYALRGAVVSDPFAVDPTSPSDLEFPCPGLEGVFCYPGDIMSEEPFLWFDFLDSLTELPQVSSAELYQSLLGDWWQWYWNRSSDNGPPLAMDDEFRLDSSTPLAVDAAFGLLANDIDPDGDAIVAELVDLPQNGTLAARSDGSFVYEPEPGFQGTDMFTYRAFDFRSESAVATVTIQVRNGAGLRGDFNDDGSLDALDLELLAAVVGRVDDPAYDLSGDGVVDQHDWSVMVQDILGSTFGDTNLDGRFDSSDLVLAFQMGRYEQGNGATADWSSGDWNGDGMFDSADLVLAFQSGNYVAAALAADRLPPTG